MMRSRMKFAWTVALAIAVGAVAAEDQAVQDKKDVEALIRDMFAKKVRELEIPSSKNAAKQCDYLTSIFEAPLVTRGKIFCDITGGAAVRFPNIHDEEMSDLGRSGVVPKSRIVESSVKGATAVVKVVQAPISDENWLQTRIVYFLKKTDGRWRISNMLAYREWPLELQREDGPCATPPERGFDFALPPTGPDQVEDIPSPCREALIKAYSRDGWGK